MVSRLKKYEVFTPGKVIISGEHSVVYGMPAVVSTMDWGITAKIFQGKMPEALSEEPYFQEIVSLFEKQWRYKVDLKKVCIEITSSLPQKSGLGSSAAFAASVFKVLLWWFGVKVTQEQFVNMVWRAENFIHGKSSGVDAVAVGGIGLFVFRKKQNKLCYERIVPEFDFSKHFSLIQSGQAEENTGEMIRFVEDRLKNDDSTLNVIKKMGETTQKIISGLKNRKNIAREIKENQQLLIELGVVGKKAQEMVIQLEKQGIISKVTGAGGRKSGSGFLLAYKAPKKARMISPSFSD